MKRSEREMLQKIRGAAFANPFDRERQDIDLAITGLSVSDPVGKVGSELLARITETTNDITSRGNRLSNQKNEEDRELLRFGLLFRVFHEFGDNFDNHINDQITAGDQCQPVPFARGVLAFLTRHDIPETEALRFFSLFFQMRRAFYFIQAIGGKSKCVMELRSSLWNNIFTSDIRLYDQFLWNRMEDFSTMILGETGTGKGMAAAAIGRSGYIPFDPIKNQFSESFSQAFTPINLSQYPEQLIESELFGHKKGAFTGAVEAHEGVFSRCNPCGAIFLDEIGEVSIPAQIKLLQVLQERIFTPVGSHQTETFQGRVIAATNKPMEKIRGEGAFRDDFYYRLCSDVIQVPPLRQRIEEHSDELTEILQFIVSRILGVSSSEIVQRVEQYIGKNQPVNYSWPGNIRELEQCVRGILLNNDYRWQQPDKTAPANLFIRRVEDGDLTASQLLSHYCSNLYQQLGTYEAVSQRTELDRRTVKKYVQAFDTSSHD